MFSRVAKPLQIVIAVVLGGAIATASACGSDSESPNQPEGEFPLQLNEATLKPRQRLAETSNLVISVTNTGTQTIPDLAVTIQTRPSDLSPEQAGVPNGSFSVRLDREDVAIQTRPVWILNADWPRLNGADTSAGAQRAQTNTYAFGELEPGDTAKMDWNLNAVQTGDFIVSWKISPSLSATSPAVDQAGLPLSGEIEVEISGQPAKVRVGETAP